MLGGVNVPADSSLRIARLVISNFRTFHGPTEIPLSAGGVADAMPVFHGGNGAGKSNAIAAIEWFFEVASYWMSLRIHLDSDDLPLSWNERDAGLQISPRDWPPGVRDPQLIEVTFANGIRLRTVLTPAGKHVIVRLEQVAPDGQGVPLAKGVVMHPRFAALRNMIETPHGPSSRALFHLDARRRADRGGAAPTTTLSDEISKDLFALATSLDPTDTERWRAFMALVGKFETLRGREVSIVQVDGVADLRFEIRGRQILRLSELSSGEQQVVAMCAAALTSRAAIVAIEEPEISLHPDNQELMRDILLEQVRSGLVDQIILESHVPTFDGPEVLRFSRSPEGSTSVERQPSNANDEVRARAKEAGAQEQWVTRDGYTRLPKEMRDDLGLHGGGYLWFLRSGPESRWQAWTADQLDEMFGWKDREPEG